MGPVNADKIHHNMEESLTQSLFQAKYVLARLEGLHDRLTGAGRLGGASSDKEPSIPFREKPEITVEVLNKADQVLSQIFTIMFSESQSVGKSEDCGPSNSIKGYR